MLESSVIFYIICLAPSIPPIPAPASMWRYNAPSPMDPGFTLLELYFHSSWSLQYNYVIWILKMFFCSYLSQDLWFFLLIQWILHHPLMFHPHHHLLLQQLVHTQKVNKTFQFLDHGSFRTMSVSRLVFSFVNHSQFFIFAVPSAKVPSISPKVPLLPKMPAFPLPPPNKGRLHGSCVLFILSFSFLFLFLLLYSLWLSSVGSKAYFLS